MNVLYLNRIAENQKNLRMFAFIEDNYENEKLDCDSNAKKSESIDHSTTDSSRVTAIRYK